MKKNELLLSFFLFIVVIIIMTFDSFGLFESKLKAPVESKLASYKININGTDIGKDKNFTINNILWKTNEHILPGKAAPSLEGEFEIIINATNVEVSFEYEIFIDLLKVENDKIKIKSFEINNVLQEANNNKYKSQILLNKTSKIDNIKITFEWENDENNNEIDSNYVGINKFLEIPISIRLSQYVG